MKDSVDLATFSQIFQLKKNKIASIKHRQQIAPGQLAAARQSLPAKQTAFNHANQIFLHKKRKLDSMSSGKAKRQFRKNVFRPAKKNMKEKLSILNSTKSQISSLQHFLATADQQIASARTRIRSNKQEIGQIQSMIPSLPQMAQRRDQLSHMVHNSVQAKAELQRKLQIAKNEKQMCITAKVKHPLAMKIMKEVASVNCSNYVMKDFSHSGFAQAKSKTQEKVLMAMCGQ